MTVNSIAGVGSEAPKRYVARVFGPGPWSGRCPQGENRLSAYWHGSFRCMPRTSIPRTDATAMAFHLRRNWGSTLVTRTIHVKRRLPAALVALLFGCSESDSTGVVTEGVTETVHVTGRGPATMQYVALWAEHAGRATVAIASWPVEPSASGHFEFSAEVDVGLCSSLTVHGRWSGSFLGLPYIEETQHYPLSSCGAHDIVLVK